MKIRELEARDASTYRKLRLRALKEHPAAFSSSYEQQRGWSLENFAERLRRTSLSPNSFILGGFLDDRLVGTVGLYREEGTKLMHSAEIVGLHIAAEYQGKGYGRALLLAALDRARQMPGLVLIRLSVVSTNEPAKSLFASLGFETYGVGRRALFVGDEYLDEELMALDLD